jgi:hypothetical protein
MAAMPRIEQEQTYPYRSKLTRDDVQRIVEICREFVDLCTRLTREIDPAVTEMLKYIVAELQRDDKPTSSEFNNFTR